MILNQKHIGKVALATLALIVMWIGPMIAGHMWAAEPKLSDAEAASISKQALSEFNSLIGGWRGVGQPKRSSRKGAWKENAQWVWDFSKGTVAIHYQITDSKLLDLAVLTYDASKKIYKLSATFRDKTQRRYQGQLKGNKLILESMPDKDNYVYRMTVTQLNEKRTLVLHEKRRSNQSFFSRIVEIGYTREGTRLAFSDQTGPKCIVTGGAGTSKVTYKGKTYYVCCSGCREAFLDDPEGIIAEAKERAEKERIRKDAQKS